MRQRTAKLQFFIDDWLRDRNSTKVLEAGCGSVTHIDFKHHAYIVGIDNSQKQLERNSYLHEKILGDIQYYDFQASTFDIVVCWDVLEHLEKPELALQNFLRVLNQKWNYYRSRAECNVPQRIADKIYSVLDSCFC